MNKPYDTIPPPFADSAERWSQVSADWRSTARDGLWRAYSDQVTMELVTSWLPDKVDALLKTDLFDEAVCDGLYPGLAAIAGSVHGIDVAEDAVEAVRDKYPALKAEIADIRALPFQDGMFDAVVSTSTLDHFEDEKDIHRSLAEIRRVMERGGQLLVTLDNPLNPKLALRARISEPLLMRAGLLPYSCGVTLAPKAFASAVQSAGFEVIERKAFLHCPRVTAVKLSNLIQRTGSARLERGFMGTLRLFEHLNALPTRWRTAHFTAILAQAV